MKRPRMNSSTSIGEACRRILEQYPRREGGLLPVLYLLQRERGWISEETMEEVADLLGLSPARVREVVSSCPGIRTSPRGRHLIEVCCALPCRLMGSEEVFRRLEEKVGIGPGDTSEDGRFTLLGVDCLGACGAAPVMRVDGELHQSLTRERIDQILEGLD